MTTVAHANLSGADLHEPKGAASASANTVYVADGAGSGAWATIDTANLDTSSIPNANMFTLTFVFTDVSTAETLYIPVPRAATLNKVTTSLQAAITVADSTITVSNHAGTTIGTITVAYSGSAAGDIDTLTASSNNTFAADTNIRVATDGGSTTVAKLMVTLEFTRTA